MLPSELKLTYDEAFPWLNGVLVAWILLIIAPRWKYTKFICAAIALLYGMVYVGVLGYLFSSEPLDFGAMSSLQGIKSLFAQDGPAFLGWTHYVVFDLWTGMWEVEDARRRGVPHLLVVVCLFTTLMFGPTGLVLYHGVRLLFGPRQQQDVKED